MAYGTNKTKILKIHFIEIFISLAQQAIIY